MIFFFGETGRIKLACQLMRRRLLPPASASSKGTRSSGGSSRKVVPQLPVCPLLARWSAQQLPSRSVWTSLTWTNLAMRKRQSSTRVFGPSIPSSNPSKRSTTGLESSSITTLLTPLSWLIRRPSLRPHSSATKLSPLPILTV